MSKIDDKIAVSERKLEETKTKFETDKTNLISLIRQRAKLEAEAVLDNKQDGKRIIEIDRQRDKLRSRIEIYPDLIKEMESRVEASKKEKEEGILKRNLDRQKKVAREIEVKSRELVATLGKADEINTSLTKLWEQRSDLAKLTNQKVVSPHVTGGSQGSLNQLYGLIRWEVEKGESRPSPRFPSPGPPI